MPARTFDRIASLPRIALLLAAIGIFLAMGYAFFMAGSMAGMAGSQLDPDRHGALGLGLWHFGTFSYYPEGMPTVERGPVYPALIAGVLEVTGGWWPGSVQLLQALIFGATILLVHWMAKTLWGSRAALVAAVVTLVHPFVLTFAARLMVELTATFLFTALVASTLLLCRRPSIMRALLAGVVLGLTILSKGVFLPFLIVVPLTLALVLAGPWRLRAATVVLVVALLPVGAWTWRNWQLTGKVIPVQLLAGYNIERGDTFVERAARAPLSYARLWEMGDDEIARLDRQIPADVTGWRREVAVDSFFTAQSLRHYREEPGFLVKKIAINSLWFWTLGENPGKTLVAALLQLSLLGLYLFAAIGVIRRRGLRSIAAVHLSWILLYWGLHLPIFAFFRLSVVLIPAMLAYAVGAIPALRERSGEPVSESEGVAR